MLTKLLRNVSIRWKLPLIAMATSGVALVLACGVFLAYDQVGSRRAAESGLSVLAEILGLQSAAAVAFDDPKVAHEILSAIAADRQIVCAAVYAADGKQLARHVRPGIAPGIVPGTPGPDGLRYEGSDLVVARPILQEQRRIGTVYVRSDLQAAWAQLNRGLLVVVLVLAASSLAALALSVKLGGMITRPILSLAEAVHSLSADRHYAVPALPEGRDEVGHLVEGFNRMLGQIRQRDAALQKANAELTRNVEEITQAQARLEEQQRELSTYHDLVTHDVTNFAGTLMMIVEHLLSHPDEKLSPGQRDLLRRANRQIYQLNRIASNAKTLMRLQQKGFPPAGAPVRLDGLVRRAVETVRAAQFDRPVNIETECPPEVSIPDIPFLENVLLNLVDNAVRHGPREGTPRIRVMVQRENGAVRVTVRGGTPVEEALRARLFDRYARGPRSAGSGLGLSVVREIVQRAGGTVAAGTAQEPEGAVFEITLTLPGV
jgi:hypothetical protein